MLRTILTRTSCIWRRSASVAPLLLPQKLFSDTLFVRTKYINYGVQGRRESKHKDKSKDKFDEDEYTDPNFEEFVNIENDV